MWGWGIWGKGGGIKKKKKKLTTSRMFQRIEHSCLDQVSLRNWRLAFFLSKLQEVSFLWDFLQLGWREREGGTVSRIFLDFAAFKVLSMRGFPAAHDISHWKLAHPRIRKHSTTTSLASSSYCQMPSLFLKLCIQGTPHFFSCWKYFQRRTQCFGLPGQSLAVLLHLCQTSCF